MEVGGVRGCTGWTLTSGLSAGRVLGGLGGRERSLRGMREGRHVKMDQQRDERKDGNEVELDEEIVRYFERIDNYQRQWAELAKCFSSVGSGMFDCGMRVLMD